jgi:ketosteroid isomerase-like protein
VSKENVEIVGGYFGGLVRGVNEYWDHPRSYAEALTRDELDANSREVLAHMHPDIRWKNAGGEIYEGRLACLQGFDGLMQASRSYSVALEEVLDLGGDHVLSVVHAEARGRSSGVPGQAYVFCVLTLRDGLIVEHDEYTTRTEALKAVGLSE